MVNSGLKISTKKLFIIIICVFVLLVPAAPPVTIDSGSGKDTMRKKDKKDKKGKKSKLTKEDIGTPTDFR